MIHIRVYRLCLLFQSLQDSLTGLTGSLAKLSDRSLPTVAHYAVQSQQEPFRLLAPASGTVCRRM